MRKGRGNRQWLQVEVGTPLKGVERRLIESTLKNCNNDKALAASLLGITARTIYRREAEWAEEDEADKG
jgi:DNA-binding NtrC family response regulator